MNMKERIELCRYCRKCEIERLNDEIEGCCLWHNDRQFGGCAEFCPKNDNPALTYEVNKIIKGDKLC